MYMYVYTYVATYLHTISKIQSPYELANLYICMNKHMFVSLGVCLKV